MFIFTGTLLICMHYRLVLLTCCLLVSFLANAQQEPTYIYDLRKHTADSLDTFKPCEPSYLVEYFSVNGKYPESSPKLLQKVKQTYRKPAGNLQSGFVTIRFLINCRGEMGWFDVFQVDSHYQKYTFENSIVEQLTAFTKSLNQWKIGKWESETVNYFAYITFKFTSGEVEQIIP